MGLQSLCCSFPTPNICHPLSRQTVSNGATNGRYQRIQLANAAKSYVVSGLRWMAKECLLPKVKRLAVVCASHSDLDAALKEHSDSIVNARVHSDPNAKLHVSPMGSTDVPKRSIVGVEPFRGKSGSVSFYGVTHQVIEESKLVSSPHKDGGGSWLWVLAPAVLILSFAVPQLFLSAVVDSVFRDEFIAETAATLASEAIFYVGFAIFLLVTDWIQRPYLQFSAKRWGLITGLKGLLTTTFFTMGLKVVAPLVVAYVTWPTLGVQALFVIAPLLVGYLAQLAIETLVDKGGCSCWPIVPIIFEVYRLYQLTRGIYSVDKLMYAMRGAEATSQIIERINALQGMIATFQVVALVCVWSLLTFLLRLFPSRPVAEKY